MALMLRHGGSTRKMAPRGQQMDEASRWEERSEPGTGQPADVAGTFPASDAGRLADQVPYVPPRRTGLTERAWPGMLQRTDPVRE